MDNKAMFLISEGIRFSALGRREDALAAAREAVMCLTPYFVQLPQAHGQNWRMFARNLRLCCQVSGIDPASDPALQQCLALLAHLETQASQQ